MLKIGVRIGKWNSLVKEIKWWKIISWKKVVCWPDQKVKISWDGKQNIIGNKSRIWCIRSKLGNIWWVGSLLVIKI